MNQPNQNGFNSMPMGEDYTQLTGSLRPTDPMRESAMRSSEEREKRQRAKLANRIYRQTCADSGVSECFFTNFATWSDYVEGRIGESEFSERARIELGRMRGAQDT